VYPEVISCFGKNDFVSLFVCPEVELSLGDSRVSATDVRFLRRLVRDAKFRNATPEFTFTIWETVRKNEERNIFPNLSHVQYRINSYLAYELYMIAPYAIRLLQAIPKESPHASAARRYLKLLQALSEISDAYLPSDSLFREFIG
jgi:uridine kinase